MIARSSSKKNKATTFRTKLAAAIMLVVAALTAFGLYLAQRYVTHNAERALQQNFQTELSALDKLLELRHAAVTERCRKLASNPRIHAALEDNALDLLYPSAKDELRDLMANREPSADQVANTLQARFYRFLDNYGAILRPRNSKDVGALSAEREGQLALKKLPEIQQIGYVTSSDLSDETIDEVTAVPIFSTETGDVISALVLGFKPLEIVPKVGVTGMKSGVWANGRLHLPSLEKSEQDSLAQLITNTFTKFERVENNFRVTVNGAPHLLFYKRLNPDSLFPPAYEVCIYPLASSIAQLHRLRWQIGGAGGLLFLGGFVSSHFIALRFSRPVEQLAVDSEENRTRRRRAEADLASTSEKLERSTRYSADASHQLKSPLTVLRAGLEALLRREDFNPETYEELSTLLHQTHRLTGVIEDLLLLSRMDAGRLQINAEPVNLSQLVEEWLDDLSALPDSPGVTIEKEIPPELYVAGEKRYTSLIVQNLLENARKYNRKGGCIRVKARSRDGQVRLTIGNTGEPIAPDAQEHIFERFRRASLSGTVAGHGLGLNLARDLARLHGGDLKFVRSGNDWTEFELQLRPTQPASDSAS
ncbi:MAG TPA: HAMP domain-containing sensor histidine kinase [Chthoniobacterales bacterium]|nr:HAMP domain-containing sensor histidine kinase [Chthoniobacterales bacterium]